MSTIPLGAPGALVPHGEADEDNGAGDGDEVDAGDGEEEELIASVAQTEGHCEFVDGELCMVDDEAGCRDGDYEEAFD